MIQNEHGHMTQMQILFACKLYAYAKPAHLVQPNQTFPGPTASGISLL